MNYIDGKDPRDYLVWRVGSGKTVEIYDIVVGSERRRGIGSELIHKLLNSVTPEVNTVWAITRSNNFIAQQFYEKLRFRVIGVLRNFYKDERIEGVPDNVDAIMYGLSIGSKA